MTVYRCYVRGHGGKEDQKLPPSESAAIDLITVGTMGCTMSDEVADTLIYRHFSYSDIKDAIDDDWVIYWTKEQRDNWYEHHVLEYEKPRIDINPYETLNINLALDGDSGIGECGLFYWNALNAELVQLIDLKDGETLLLSEILENLKSMLNEGDTVHLFWTACMSGKVWPGSGKKVSFNPKKK